MMKKLLVVMLVAIVGSTFFASTADEGRFDAKENAIHEIQIQKAREWRAVVEHHAQHRHIDGKCVIK